MILIEEVKIQEKSVGLVVAVSPGEVGYSICNPIEKKFILGRAVEIAIGRAKKTGAVSKLESIVRNVESEYCGSRKHSPGTISIKRYNNISNLRERIDMILISLKRIKRRSEQVL